MQRVNGDDIAGVLRAGLAPVDGQAALHTETSGILIELTADEIHYAALHGIMRRMQKVTGKRADRLQREASTWDNEIEGACAELAFCKWRGVYWTGMSGLRARDGGDFEVRYTRHEGKGGLIVYAHDSDDIVFVLMDGRAPRFQLVGWLRGAEGKHETYRTDFGFLVPRSHLHSRFVRRALPCHA